MSSMTFWGVFNFLFTFVNFNRYFETFTPGIKKRNANQLPRIIIPQFNFRAFFIPLGFNFYAAGGRIADNIYQQLYPKLVKV